MTIVVAIIVKNIHFGKLLMVGAFAAGGGQRPSRLRVSSRLID